MCQSSFQVNLQAKKIETPPGYTSHFEKIEHNWEVLLKIAIIKFQKCKGRQHTISAKFVKNTCKRVSFLRLQPLENMNPFKYVFQRLCWSGYFRDFTSLIKGALQWHLFEFCTSETARSVLLSSSIFTLDFLKLIIKFHLTLWILKKLKTY